MGLTREESSASLLGICFNVFVSIGEESFASFIEMMLDMPELLRKILLLLSWGWYFIGLILLRKNLPLPLLGVLLETLEILLKNVLLLYWGWCSWYAWSTREGLWCAWTTGDGSDVLEQEKSLLLPLLLTRESFDKFVLNWGDLEMFLFFRMKYFYFFYLLLMTKLHVV